MADLEIIRSAEKTPLEPLLSRTVAIIGYGNQGRAHALNLRESGVAVVVATRRKGAGWNRAEEDGFVPQEVSAAAGAGDLVIIALPDESQPTVYRDQIAPHLKPGTTVGFIHGFSIHYRLIEPARDIGVVMIAPKGPGTTLRQGFVDGLGIPCLYALHQDSPEGNAREIAFAWARGIGCASAGIICTTFADETETDLFGEQAVLCGGITSLILAAFETLVKAGYPPELAYLECCHEVKQIADLVYERGLSGMMKAISNTAEFGAYRAGPMVIDDLVRRKLDALLDEIRAGHFAESLREDHSSGFPWFKKQREALASHPIEHAGEVIRTLMPRTSPTDDG